MTEQLLGVCGCPAGALTSVRGSQKLAYCVLGSAFLRTRHQETFRLHPLVVSQGKIPGNTPP